MKSTKLLFFVSTKPARGGHLISPNLFCLPIGSLFDFFFCPLQTVFIIAVCNNQLLNWIENELIWVLSLIPGFASILPNVIVKLTAMQDKYLTASSPQASNIKVFLHAYEAFILILAWSGL
jgi:hypothetical protein